MRKIPLLFLISAVTMIFSQSALAAFGVDTDKPAPTFSRTDDSVIATLIPRGKNSNIEIQFDAAAGKLTDVTATDFATAKRDNVNVRDFRSDLFSIVVAGITPGTETRVSIRSDYFTTSTRFWVFNEKEPAPWVDAQATVAPLPGRVKELTVTVKDGGPMDSDGLENGSILLVGGPMDSFWSYAFGTLFIRIFGIFLVLMVLMMGMLLSSRIFRFIEGWKEKSSSRPVELATVRMPEPAEKPVTPAMAAAIGIALHLHLRSGPQVLDLSTESAPWTAQGRAMTMATRSRMFDRARPAK